MPTILLPLLPGSLPANACYNTEQDRLNAFAENLQAQLPGQAFYNYGDSTPAVENNAYPWLRTTDGLWYRFSGSWISPVGPQYHVGVRQIWVGNAAALITYDGGDNDPPSDRSGPMWEIDNDFDGRSPMGQGAISGSDPAKNLANGENFGVGSNTIAGSNMPEHRHGMKFSETTSGSTYPSIATGSTDDRQYFTEMAGNTTPTPLNNVHPVRGVYIIKWTGRAYRRA